MKYLKYLSTHARQLQLQICSTSMSASQFRNLIKKITKVRKASSYKLVLGTFQRRASLSSNQPPHLCDSRLRHNAANCPTSVIFYSCVTMGQEPSVYRACGMLLRMLLDQWFSKWVESPLDVQGGEKTKGAIGGETTQRSRKCSTTNRSLN